ncbi:hypothetical protein [Echinicola shivajiensis]|uniref:hypothetical protein n=1 Tax=Echinicola shivajiensis TaxID=1035916 RepID=UPI001BFC41E6|nr:hypothetical protein [Echinicola shivajiensis]
MLLKHPWTAYPNDLKLVGLSPIIQKPTLAADRHNLQSSELGPSIKKMSTGHYWRRSRVVGGIRLVLPVQPMRNTVV